MRSLIGLPLLLGCTTADHALDDVKGRLCVFANPTHDSLDALESRGISTWPTEFPQDFHAGDPLALRLRVADERFIHSGTCTPIVEASCEVDYSSLDTSILAIRSRLEWNDYDGPCTREAFHPSIACNTRILDARTYNLSYRRDTLTLVVPSARESAPCIGNDLGY